MKCSDDFFVDGVNDAEGLLIEAGRLFEEAEACLNRRDYKGLALLLRQSSSKHAAIAVLYGELAAQFERLNFS